MERSKFVLFAQIPGEGPLHESELRGKDTLAFRESAPVERPPHRDPPEPSSKDPASGEREQRAIDAAGARPYGPRRKSPWPRCPVRRKQEAGPMKIRNSLKSLRGRHRDNRIVRRKGRVYIINKTQRRFKARQG